MLVLSFHHHNYPAVCLFFIVSQMSKLILKDVRQLLKDCTTILWDKRDSGQESSCLTVSSMIFAGGSRPLC